MLPFRSFNITLNSGDFAEINHNIRSRIVKGWGFWVGNTSHWVIFPERLFLGKDNKNGSVTVARNRLKFYSLFPLILTNWHLREESEKITLSGRHTLSFRSLLGYGILIIIPSVAIFFRGELNLTILWPLTILAILLGLMFREAKVNEKLLKKIAYEKLEEE